jgi:hypothetical protein
MAILQARAACRSDPATALAMYGNSTFGPTLAAVRLHLWGIVD